MEELTTSADLNQRWAQKFQRVHNNNPPILNATTPIQTKSAPQKQPIVSIASLIDSSLKEKQQNVRRRLFVEEEEANISTSISRMKPTDKDTKKANVNSQKTNKTSINKSNKTKTEADEPNFFDGPGASAWLNFTLSLSDFNF